MCSGPCDRCAVTEKQITKTNTEFIDTNQKNLSVISELGEDFCFPFHFASSYCDSIYIYIYYMYQSISINLKICYNVCIAEFRGREEDSER